MSGTTFPHPTFRRLLIPGVVSLCAIGAGAWACELNDVPASVWGRNLAAWLVGGMAALALQRIGSRARHALLPAAVIVLGASFLGPDQSGVHRWLSLGPFSINAAMLVLPGAVVAMAASDATSRWRWLLSLACMALLLAQPDRSQAAAFGAAVIWIALRTTRIGLPQLAIVGASALLVVGTFLRPDPLQPVPEVEEIFQLAFAVSPGLAAAGLIALLAFCVTPLWMARGASRGQRLIGEALSLYFLVSAVMPFLGAYPVPLVGVGVSPILGAWIAIAAMQAAGST